MFTAPLEGRYRAAVRLEREKLEICLREMAKKTGVNPTYLSKVELAGLGSLITPKESISSPMGARPGLLRRRCWQGAEMPDLETRHGSPELCLVPQDLFYAY